MTTGTKPGTGRYNVDADPRPYSPMERGAVTTEPRDLVALLDSGNVGVVRDELARRLDVPPSRFKSEDGDRPKSEFARFYLGEFDQTTTSDQRRALVLSATALADNQYGEALLWLGHYMGMDHIPEERKARAQKVYKAISHVNGVSKGKP